MQNIVRVVGISGSLRKGSFNTMLLNEAVRLKPEGIEIEVLDFSAFPVYNQDIEEAGLPEAVSQAKVQIAGADAVLIATPEYNYGIPGPLKNAIDWISRPYGTSPFGGKPLAIMGASPGMLGTIRAQLSLRQTAVFLDMHALTAPEIYLARAHEKFDSDGKLTDEMAIKLVGQLLENLKGFAQRAKG